MITKFFDEWDYDNDVVTTYERAGQCNKCGECCEAKITYVARPQLGKTDNPQTADWWLHTNAKGIWNEIQIYGRRRFIQLRPVILEQERCKALTRSNKCLLHLFGVPGSALCAIWPLSPKFIEPFPYCGFTFVEVERRVISEIPHD